MDINAAGSSAEGVAIEKIEALERYCESELFSPAERAALELADALTATPAEVSDELFARLRAHYDEATLVELAASIAYENFRSRFNRAFEVEPQGFYCPLPTSPKNQG